MLIGTAILLFALTATTTGLKRKGLTPTTTGLKRLKPVKSIQANKSLPLLPPLKTNLQDGLVKKPQAPPSQLRETFESVSLEVMETLRHREDTIGSDIPAFLASVNTGQALFSDALQGCYELEDEIMSVMLENITTALDELRISSDAMTHNLLTLTKWVRLSKKSKALKPNICRALLHPFKRIVGFLKGTQLWYLFLEELSSSLATYEVQNARFDQHRRTKLWDIAKAGNVTKENLVKTFKVIYEEHRLFTLRNSVNTLVSSATQRRLEHLTGALQDALTSVTTCEMEGAKLKLKGTNVFLSEALGCLRPGVSTLAIVATSRIFIDIDLHAVDLNAGNPFDLIIVSPQWVVVGARTINLSGPNGGNFAGIFDKTLGILKVVSHGGSGGPGRPGYIKLFPLDPSQPEVVQIDPAHGTAEVREAPQGEIANTLLDFKVSARIVNNPFFKSHLRNFVSAVHNHPELASFQTPLHLIDEFHALESQAPVLKKDPDLGNYYESISLRAHKRAVQIASSTSTSSKEEQQTLLFLSAAALGRKLSHTSDALEPILVINMHDFLTSELKRLTKLQQFSDLQKVHSEYDKYMDSKLDQLHVLVHTIILPEIDAVEVKLNQLVGISLENIKQLRGKAAENQEALRKYRERLHKYQKFSWLFTGLKFAGNILSFFVPVAGKYISNRIDYAENMFNPKPEQPQLEHVEMPAAVVQGTKFAALRFNRDNGLLLRNFRIQINAVERILKRQPAAFDEPIRYTKELRQLSDSKISENPASNQFHSNQLDEANPFVHLLGSESFVANSLQHLQGAVMKAQDTAVGLGIPQDKVKRVAELAQGLISMGLNVYQNVADKGNLREAKHLFSQADGDANRLAQHQERIENTLIPELKEMLNFVHFAVSELSNKPKEMLEVIKWRLQSVLRDAKLEFRKEFTEGTGIEDYMSRSLEKLEEAYTTLIRLYEHVDSFRDQRALTQFFVTASTTGQFANGPVQDEKLQTAVAELQHLIRANVILERQKIVTASYRLWLFPFGVGPSCQMESSSVNTTDVRTPEKLEILLNQVGHSYHKMLDRVSDARNTIRHGDKYMIKTEFQSHRPYTPYYTWSNSSFSRSISSLLEGKTVVLFAHAESSSAKCDAIKFQTIAPIFTSPVGDAAVENTMKDALKDYAVTMKYLGNSHYRLGNSTYVLPSNALELHFSFMQGADGSPSSKNEVYNKLERGDLMLSPFTLWEFQLEPIWDNAPATSLLKFKGLVDLNLVGTGVCMRGFQVSAQYQGLSDCEKA